MFEPIEFSQGNAPKPRPKIQGSQHIRREEKIKHIPPPQRPPKHELNETFDIGSIELLEPLAILAGSELVLMPRLPWLPPLPQNPDGTPMRQPKPEPKPDRWTHRPVKEPEKRPIIQPKINPN